MTPSAAEPESSTVVEGAGLNRWTVAAADTRAAAKWMIGSLAAAAALIFGAGPIVNRPDLSWSDNRPQLGIALAAGAFGLICLILLIGQIAAVLTPRKISLESVPDEMLRDLNAAADVRLPSGSDSYAEFLKRYRAYKVLVGTLSARLARLDDSAPDASVQRAQLDTLLDEAQRNVGVYARAAEGYLNQAEFYSVSALFGRKRALAVTLAVGAAVGALGFQLALAAGPEKSPEAPDLAYLLAPSEPNELWTALDLEACAVGDRVPVVLSGGKGSDDDPYAVTVLKTKDECVPTAFDLRGDALTLEKPSAESVTINYTP